MRQFVILGAWGDLTARYLTPALLQLEARGRLPDGFSLIAVGRRSADHNAYRDYLRQQWQRHATDVPREVQERLASRCRYGTADATDPGALAAVLGELSEPTVLYLALPPAVYGPTVAALGEMGLPEGSRIVVEKPFGEDFASARRLNELLHRAFPERAIFRIDHFLGMQKVQNLLGLRFANRVFEHLWNRDHIDRVEVVWDETLTLEGRASYYDSAGALRDMIQNHLLQMLCLAAMEPPLSLSERDFRDRKLDVLRAVRTPSRGEVERLTTRARYTAGKIGDRGVPAYVDEEGIEPQRRTETFAQVTLLIDNWRWSGVPFTLRTGKALGRNHREMTIHFRPVPHLPFEDNAPLPNVLRMFLDPDRVTLSVNVNCPGDPLCLQPIEFRTDLAPQELPAYARLLCDVLEGDQTLFIRGDEAEEAWRIVDPILRAWSDGAVPLDEYPAGSAGPERGMRHADI